MDGGQADQREGRRTQAQRRAAAESALLAAAAAVAVESGVAALTLAAVGQRAGYSRGIVTHHFGSKRGLLEAVARDAQAGVVPEVDQYPAGLQRLLILIEGYVRGLGREQRRWHPFLLLWAEAAQGGELAPVMRERDAWFRDYLRTDVIAGIDAGAINPECDPQDVAVAILGQLRGIGLQQLLHPDAADLDRLARSVALGWRRALSVGAHPDVPGREQDATTADC